MGAQIRVRRLQAAPLGFRVHMPLTALNKNAVGTHFGGSLFAMADPFFMIILMNELGPDYVVWDTDTTIKFVRPGRSTVHADFVIPAEVIESIRNDAAMGVTRPRFQSQIVDEEGGVVAKIDKQLYIRKKVGDLEHPSAGT